MLRWLTAGESHGPSLVAILEGLPAHVRVTTTDIQESLARRRLGYGRGARMKFERDEVTILGGVRHGETMGGPVAIQVANTEWPKWDQVMSADPVDEVELASWPATRRSPGPVLATPTSPACRSTTSRRRDRSWSAPPRARPRPGRPGPGRRQLPRAGRRCPDRLHVVGLGGVKAPAGLVPEPDDVARLDEDPVRCLDADTSKAMVAAIEQAHRDGDTLGGVVEVVVHGLPPGLGSHVHWDRRLDARLAGALMGIQAIKGVEVGDGFELAATPARSPTTRSCPPPTGSAASAAGPAPRGMTTGEVLRVRAAMKPIATVPRALRTVDVTTGEEAVAHHQRSDVCAVPAAGIVAEAMVALVLAEAVLEKFGGDSVGETRRRRRTTWPLRFE